MSTFRRWWFIIFDDEAGAPAWAFGHVVRLINVAMAGPTLTSVSMSGPALTGVALSGPTLTNVSII